MKLSKLSLLLLLLCCFQLVFAITAVYGDSRSQPEIHKLIVEQIMSHHPVAVFHTGDMVSYGLRQSEYDDFFKQIKPITDSSHFFAAMGNHERNRELYMKNFPEPNDRTYYTVEEDSLEWIVLDTNMKVSPGSPQYKWLVEQLNRFKHQNIIVITHHPMFSSGEHGDELGLSMFLPDLFAQYPVLAVFSGHDHSYERSLYKGTWYIVTGGGGAPLYNNQSKNPYSKVFMSMYNFCILERTGDKLEIKAFDTEGRQLDECTTYLNNVPTPEDK